MPSNRDSSWRLRGFARVMRHEPSKTETKLWKVLRDRRLGGFKFRRQVPIEGYIVDFYCDEKKVAIELDGDQHHEVNAKSYDERRDWRLEKLGIWTFWFPSLSVFKHMSVVRESILEALERTLTPALSRGTGRGSELMSFARESRLEVRRENTHPGPLPAYREREWRFVF